MPRLCLGATWRAGLTIAFCLPLLLACPGGRAAHAVGEVTCSVFYGGQFNPEQAQSLAGAKAWLDGLELASASLAKIEAVRLAGLDGTRRQALAAQLNLVEVNADAPDQHEPSGRHADEEPAPAAGVTFHWPEGLAQAQAEIRQPDKTDVSRALADVELRDRFEEVIVALRRITPEAIEWAERGHSLRKDALDQNEPGAADELVAARLSFLAAETEAYRPYLAFLRDAEGQPPADALRRLEDALSWTRDLQMPLRLARAEMLLRQDRPQAARRVLSDLKEPPAEATPEETSWINARSPIWSSVWQNVWGPHPSDRRLYARGLRLRALAQLRSGQFSLAEEDLDLAVTLEPERADLLLERGAVRQVRERFGPMCEDYYQACVFGRCEGLAAARESGRCPPETTEP